MEDQESAPRDVPVQVVRVKVMPKSGRKNPLTSKFKKALQREWKRRPEVLLCPNIPKPMHGLAPRVVLGQKWWDKTRQAAYTSTLYHCIACGVYKHDARGHKWLEGHEWYDIDYAKGRMVYVETIPLCNYCHSYIHDGRLLALLKSREITAQRYAAVIQHGDRVLAAAGLQRMTHAERDEAIKQLILAGKIADWGRWRLVVDGKKYKPLYKSYEEWEQANV